MLLTKNNSCLRAALAALLFWGFHDCHAADLKAPFELESSLTLPQGVRNPRVRQLFMTIDERWNQQGSLEPLGQKLNKTVTWNDVLSAQPTDADRMKVLANMQDQGISIDSSPGQTTGVVQSRANVTVPVIAYGLTDRWTMALAVPVYKVVIKADTGFIRTPEGQRFVDGAAASEPLKGEEAAMKLNDAINQKLSRLGYEPVQSMSVTALGDMRLVSKLNVYRDEQQGVTWRADLVTPTGRKANVNRVVDVVTSDGTFSLGQGVTYDRRLPFGFQAGISANYLFQLPNTMDRRIPVSGTDALSADIERVSRDLGDQQTVATSLSYTIPRAGLSLGAGYSIQHQNKTRFKGLLFSNERYGYLEAESPEQLLQSTVFGLGFSTVEWFKQKEFIVPLQANLAYSIPVLGKNVTTNSIFSAELVLFF